MFPHEFFSDWVAYVHVTSTPCYKQEFHECAQETEMRNHVENMWQKGWSDENILRPIQVMPTSNAKLHSA